MRLENLSFLLFQGNDRDQGNEFSNRQREGELSLVEEWCEVRSLNSTACLNHFPVCPSTDTCPKVINTTLFMWKTGIKVHFSRTSYIITRAQSNKKHRASVQIQLRTSMPFWAQGSGTAHVAYSWSPPVYLPQWWGGGIKRCSWLWMEHQWVLAQFREMAKEWNHLSQDAKSTCEKNRWLRSSYLHAIELQ